MSPGSELRPEDRRYPQYVGLQPVQEDVAPVALVRMARPAVLGVLEMGRVECPAAVDSLEYVESLRTAPSP